MTKIANTEEKNVGNGYRFFLYFYAYYIFEILNLTFEKGLIF